MGIYQPLGIHPAVSGVGSGGRRPYLRRAAGPAGGRVPAPGLARLAASAQTRRLPGLVLPGPLFPGPALFVKVIRSRPVSLVYLEPVHCLFLALGLKTALRVERWPRHLAILVLVAAAGLGAWRLHGVGLKDYSAYRAVYAALAATPKDALIAGHPNLMDNIPTFAQRRAFATYELAHPWSRGYWAQLKPRLEDLFTAYYAADPQEVVAFCRKYGIAFLIVDDRHFTPAFLKGGYFLFPGDKPHLPGKPRGWPNGFTSHFSPRLMSRSVMLTAGRAKFALLSDPVFPAVAMDQHVRLIDMRPWLTPKP